MSAARYTPYPAYKPSGVEWLRDIPEGWEIFNGKRLFGNRRETALPTDEQLAASQAFGVVPQSVMMARNNAKVMLATKGTASFRHVEKDDFVISLRSFEGGIEHSAYTGCVSPAYTVLQPLERLDPPYFRYLLKSTPFVSALQATTDSLRDGKSISYEQFGAIALNLPSLPEQTKIAAFLDHETAKIDALIAKQQRLIELLEEKRQAVISHAVTKGLDPTAPLRPSGIDWLGDVPEHWEVKRLKYLCNVNTGTRNTEDAKEDGKFPFFVRSQTVQKINTGPYDCEAILTAGDGAGVGKVYHYFEGQFDCHQRVYMLTDFEELTGKFIFDYLENNFFNVALAGQAKSTVDSLRMPVFLNFELTVPPREEQLEIVNHVAAKKRRFLALSHQAQSAITLLKERRTALISAAVTGKIDVRDWQPPQPLSDTDFSTETLQEAAL